MKEETRPDDPAMPMEVREYNEYAQEYVFSYMASGLTKREDIAKHMMGATCQNTALSIDERAKLAVSFADALIRALNK